MYKAPAEASAGRRRRREAPPGFAADAVLSHGRLGPDMHVMPTPFAIAALATRTGEMTHRRIPGRDTYSVREAGGTSA